MLRSVLFLILSFRFLGFADAQKTGEQITDADSTKNAVLKVENQFDEALLANDTRALASLSAEGYFYVGTNAEILTKSQRLEQMQTGLMRYSALREDDLHVVVYGDTVIVSGRSTSTVLIGDKGSWGPHGASHQINPGRLSGNALFTHAYVKIQGRWQMILEHVTYITED
jgi:hypothetical protein